MPPGPFTRRQHMSLRARLDEALRALERLSSAARAHLEAPPPGKQHLSAEEARDAAVRDEVRRATEAIARARMALKLKADAELGDGEGRILYFSPDPP